QRIGLLARLARGRGDETARALEIGAHDLVAVGDEARDERRVIAVGTGELLVDAVVDRTRWSDQHGPATPPPFAADLAARDDDGAAGRVDEHRAMRGPRRARAGIGDRQRRHLTEREIRDALARV